VKKVAKSNTTCLIRGETGTGKELIAGAIHHNSTRATRNFVKVNCAALQENLLESELFGHEKGAFTGADKQRVGRFEQADGGTLFLDEVGDMSANTQAKILRVLQEHEFERLGGTRTLRTDVRVIAATNRNLPQMVANGQFREDLFYRINVIELRVPPLRERPEDLPILADAILERLALTLGRQPARLAPDAVTLLQAYSFPGNVRELENTLERATTLAEGDLIRAVDIHLHGPALPSDEPATIPLDAGQRPLGSYLGDVEKEAIRKALEQTRYNKTAAAKLLGMTFRQLRYRIKKLGLE
jgi:two-component system response regulator PilR (NtrC family)